MLMFPNMHILSFKHVYLPSCFSKIDSCCTSDYFILFLFPFNREAEEFEEVEKKLVSFPLIVTCLIFRNFALFWLYFGHMNRMLTLKQMQEQLKGAARYGYKIKIIILLHILIIDGSRSLFSFKYM